MQYASKHSCVAVFLEVELDKSVVRGPFLRWIFTCHKTFTFSLFFAAIGTFCMYVKYPPVTRVTGLQGQANMGRMRESTNRSPNQPISTAV